MPIMDHTVAIPLEDNSIVWRYMDLEKFESLLSNSALFFCRIDKFADPFEGSVPKKEYESREHRLPNKGFTELHHDMAMFNVANCWHINENESDAMWRLYLKTNEGVAIQSNKQKLYTTFEECNEYFYLTKVKYIDFDNDIWYNESTYPDNAYNALLPLMHKRIEFKHENEFRIIHPIHYEKRSSDYWKLQDNDIGEVFKVNINKLVDKIILPPTSDYMVENKVKKLVEKYGFCFKMEKSKLVLAPYF